MGIFVLVFACMLFLIFFNFLFLYINEIALLLHVIGYVALDVSVNLKLHGTNQVNNC